MTILLLIQDVCAETNWASSPSTVVSAPDKKILQLKQFAEKVGRVCRRAYPFRELNVEHTFTLLTGVESYALPTDFDFELWGTHWNRSEYWRVLGPLTSQQWQYYKSGNLSTPVHQYFRFKGCGLKQYFIAPAPTASNNGQTCVFEYQSKSTILPAEWVNATLYAAGSYCSYDGAIYYTIAGGTSNGTLVTNDIGITWALTTETYDRYLADTDSPKLDEELIKMGTKAYFKKEYRFDGWQEDLNDFQAEMRNAFGRSMGAKIVSMDNRAEAPWPNIPQTGFGNYDPDPYS